MNYDLDLKGILFNAIKSGKKTVETRTKVPHTMVDYEKMEKGDTITFTNLVNNEVLKVEVLAIRHYPDAREMLLAEGLDKTLSYPMELDDAVESYNELNGYTDGIKKYGIWAIEIKKL